IDAVRAVQAATPQHTHIELTKRPRRMREHHRDPIWRARAVYAFEALIAGGHARLSDGRQAAEQLTLLKSRDAPLPNLWGGTSCSTQADADALVPAVLETPLARHIVSLEPLL